MLIFQGVSIHKHPAAMGLAKEHQLWGIATKRVDISCGNDDFLGAPSPAKTIPKYCWWHAPLAPADFDYANFNF